MKRQAQTFYQSPKFILTTNIQVLNIFRMRQWELYKYNGGFLNAPNGDEYCSVVLFVVLSKTAESKFNVEWVTLVLVPSNRRGRDHRSRT